ncbi:MAG: hypothetical protein HC822_27715 [Oscillochloris sp.]|nr:hypothetical protein [Oscillochloris sp.]
MHGILGANSLSDDVAVALGELIAAGAEGVPAYLVIAVADHAAWRELARSFEGALDGALPALRWRNLAQSRGELVGHLS